MNILITGASGFIGQALCQALAQEHVVFGLFRTPPQPTPDRPERPVSDIREIDAPLDAVINLAGENIGASRWSERRKLALRGSRIAFTETLLQKLATTGHKPGVWINASAVGYYGSQPGVTLHEDSTAGTDFAAQLCVDWEKTVTQAPVLQGSRKVLLRLGVVIGPGGGVLAQMRLPFALGLGTVLGPGDQHMPWVSRHDVIRVIQQALISPAYSGPLNVVSPQAQTQEQFSNALASTLKRPRWLRLPTPMITLLFGEMSSILLADQNVEPMALTELGFEFNQPRLSDALENALQRNSH